MLVAAAAPALISVRRSSVDEVGNWGWFCFTAVLLDQRLSVEWTDDSLNPDGSVRWGGKHVTSVQCQLCIGVEQLDVVDAEGNLDVPAGMDRSVPE